MKILNISGYTWDFGGPPKIIYDHAEVQIKLGAEVTILTAISKGQTLYSIPEGAKVITFKRHWFAKFWAEFSPEIYHWMKENGNNYDIIHIHGLWNFASITPYLTGVKSAKCITIHGMLDKWSIKHGYLKKKIFSLFFQKSILKNTDLIQVNNTDEEEDVFKFLGFKHPNLKIIPNGMNINNFSKIPEKGNFRKKFLIPDKTKIILFLSRINIKKGLDLLLPAFKDIIKQHPDCQLVIAGSDDGYLEETKEFISKNQLKSYIKIVGMLTGEDKMSAFADADIFVLPSYSEGFSIATLEALIMGVPSLLSDRVGFGESIKTHNAAHIVELSVDSIKKGLEKMLTDEEYCTTIAKNGVALVKNKYDIELVGKQLFTEFEKVKNESSYQK